MGKFYSGGKEGNYERFREFLRDFMDSRFFDCRLRDLAYADIVWKYFRNGLTHGFAICHGGFKHQNEYFTVDKQTLVIDPRSFLDDFLDGTERYLDLLEGASPNDKIAQDFKQVFHDVFIIGR
jgi:hypothetical protein